MYLVARPRLKSRPFKELKAMEIPEDALCMYICTCRRLVFVTSLCFELFEQVHTSTGKIVLVSSTRGIAYRAAECPKCNLCTPVIRDTTPRDNIMLAPGRSWSEVTQYVQ